MLPLPNNVKALNNDVSINFYIEENASHKFQLSHLLFKNEGVMHLN